jgi:L-ascorbate metabolism protein UlaG (beta-lactamase superfamily)
VRRLLRWFAIGLGVIVLSTAIAVALAYFVRPGMDEYAEHRYVAPPREGSLTATWFGNTAIVLSDGHSAVILDPFFTRPTGIVRLFRNEPIEPDEALIAAWLTRAGITRLDAVLVSHSHYDHALDCGVVARLTGARLVGSASTANLGRGGGVPESQIEIAESGKSLMVGSFKVTFLESRHAGATGGVPTGDITAPLKPPARYTDYRQGGTYSILVEHAQGSVLHQGSAGFLPGALEGRHAGIVFLGVALLPDMEAYLTHVVDAVGAKRVVPIHWDDFTRPLDAPMVPLPVLVNLPRFFDATAHLRPGLQIQTLELAEPVRLFDAP